MVNAGDITLRAVLTSLLASGACLACAQASSPWTGSWSSSQMSVCDHSQLPATSLKEATLRQTVHLSIGGDDIRLRLSNAFGERPLVIRSVWVASAGAPGVLASKNTPVLFNHAAEIRLPAHAEYLSDPIPLHVEALSNLAVTMLIGETPACITSHPGARTTSVLAAGDHTAEATLDPAEKFQHWYFLSSVEVNDAHAAGAVAVLGDSITDGRGSTDDANNRWPDILAKRIAPLHAGVLNLGIGGNCVLMDCLGPSALARFDRDVLGNANVHAVIVFEGVNDLGGMTRMHERPQTDHDALVTNIEEAFRQIALKAHEHGIRILGGTITPFVGSNYYHPGPQTEADRAKINQWIRTTKDFDGVIDFDAMLRDPAQPDHMAASSQTVDLLHPGPAGYQRMGEGVSVDLIKEQLGIAAAKKPARKR